MAKDDLASVVRLHQPKPKTSAERGRAYRKREREKSAARSGKSAPSPADLKRSRTAKSPNALYANGRPPPFGSNDRPSRRPRRSPSWKNRPQNWWPPAKEESRPQGSWSGGANEQAQLCPAQVPIAPRTGTAHRLPGQRGRADAIRADEAHSPPAEGLRTALWCPPGTAAWR